MRQYTRLKITPLGFIVLLVIVFFLTRACRAQVGGGSIAQAPTEPSYSVPEHPQHASQGTLRTEQNLRSSGGITTAQGERPLSDFPQPSPEKPLGDVAREYRKLALYGSEKARIHWDQQGK